MPWFNPTNSDDTLHLSGVFYCERCEYQGKFKGVKFCLKCTISLRFGLDSSLPFCEEVLENIEVYDKRL